MENKVVVGAGAFGALITYAFGGWSGLLEIFFIAMALDFASGMLSSLKEGKGLDSDTAKWGLLKKALMIAAVYLAHRADIALGTDYIMMGMVYAFLVAELISLAENYARLGLPLGEYLKPLLTILKNRGESK